MDRPNLTGAAFFELVGGPWNRRHGFGAGDAYIRIAIQRENRLVRFADDEPRGARDALQIVSGQIRAAAPRHDRQDKRAQRRRRSKIV